MSEFRRLIAQADPRAGYLAAREEIDEAVARVLGSGAYVLGQEGEAFEAAFAGFLGATSALGCASGTDAIVLALKALGIGPGDAVVTVSHTAVATVAAIEIAGATPVLLDIDEDTYTLDPVELEAVLASPPPGTPPIRAVVLVHLYGQPADMDVIRACTARHDVALVEDCAQAHGAQFRGRPVGTWSAAAAYSFYPTKNLGGFGDGGAVVTSDPVLADRVRALRQYGWARDRISDHAGVNSRLDELQAAVLRVKLKRLEADNARRRAIAGAYDLALAGGPIRSPTQRSDRIHVFHQYVVRHQDRDEIRRRLGEAGIGTAVHYPVPVHLQPAYRELALIGPKRCRTTERISQEILSLPMHPHLDDNDLEAICKALKNISAGLRTDCPGRRRS